MVGKKKHKKETKTQGSDVDYMVERNSTKVLNKQLFNMFKET